MEAAFWPSQTTRTCSVIPKTFPPSTQITKRLGTSSFNLRLGVCTSGLHLVTVTATST